MNVRNTSALAFLLLIAAANSAHAALAPDCTLYAAADGIDGSSGTSPTSPKTLRGASSASQPGSVICLKGGTYNLSSRFLPAKSGTASAWIVYKAYGDGDVNFIWTGGTEEYMFHFTGTTPWSGQSYIEVRGLNFDGRNITKAGFKCLNAHHLRFIGNTIQNTSEAGIQTVLCDYVTADSNKISHAGYLKGFSSGISYNSHQWYDTAPGFHSFVVNNVISGTYDASSHHSDGKGIIMDLSSGSGDYSTANTPPVLIANNVVYQNGGGCITIYVVTNIWTVNNTCYKNTLDLTQSGIGEIRANNSKDSFFINNIAYAWNGRYAYQRVGTTQNIIYYRNMYYGGNNNFTYSDPSQFIKGKKSFFRKAKKPFFKADPLFTDPPYVDPTQDGQYATALPATQIETRLTLQASSPAIDRGRDPTTIRGASPEIIAGLRQYVFTDINGNPRPQGKRFDIGAYEYADQEDEDEEEDEDEDEKDQETED